VDYEDITNIAVYESTGSRSNRFSKNGNYPFKLNAILMAVFIRM